MRKNVNTEKQYFKQYYEVYVKWNLFAIYSNICVPASIKKGQNIFFLNNLLTISQKKLIVRLNK